MKLTSKGRYAVMAMADLAKINTDQPTSLTEISLRQGISISFLEQIFLKLKRNNLVQSSRGPSGGYSLIKSPEEIKLSTIIKAVDEEIKTVGCKKESKKGCNNKSSKCITHNLWDQLDQHINNFFEKVKLQDLVKSSRGPSGGYLLTRSPEEIKLSSIIKAVDERVKTLGCKRESKKGCNGKSIKCITHNLWDELEIHINNFFEKNTLKDIIYRVNRNRQKELT